jgi:hypothetical protein
MKKITALSLLLVLAVTSFAWPPEQAGNSFESFWQAFKAAVTKRDIETITRLSDFPIEMPYGFPMIRTKAQLTKRYRQVFNQQTDAAACFANAKPEKDDDKGKVFRVVCPDEGGAEVIVYYFVLTRTGWKFSSLDNINE